MGRSKKTPSYRREEAAIRSVSCDECGARVGEPCRLSPETIRKLNGRIIVHGVRRRAWQALAKVQPAELAWCPACQALTPTADAGCQRCRRSR